MHYYTHHIGDFLRDAGHLTNEQLGVYMKMLWRYYLNQKPLENDPESLAFAVGADEKIVLQILRHFFCLTEEGWRQPRCDREIANFQNKSQKARHSANARWSNANAYQTHTERNANASKNDANQEPITNNHKPKITPKPPAQAPEVLDRFSRFWNAYPRKTAKANAQKSFVKIKPTEELLETMLKALEWQKEQDSWKKDDGKFIPHPASWLNAARWEDEPAGASPDPDDWRKNPLFAGGI